MHVDPMAKILFDLALILTLGTIGRFVARKFSQPPVFGELCIGILAAVVLSSMRVPASSFIRDLTTLGNLGVILLLFSVGLDTKLENLRKVGWTATAVGVVGVVFPIVLGFLSVGLLLPESTLPVRLFVGATLCATSVGITARVLRDLGKVTSAPAQIILGAAILDDILGLIILSVASSAAMSGSVDMGNIARILILSSVFFGIFLFFGPKLVAKLFDKLNFLDPPQALLIWPLITCFLLSWLAAQIQLAAIIGAFTAGLIIGDRKATGVGARSVQEWLHPLESLFAPIFFVLMGLQVEFETLTSGHTLLLTFVLTVMAIVGKLACALVVRAPYRWSVGVGMIPRGEVGLIFAAVGRSMGFLNRDIFTAVILMVAITTVITPVALKWTFRNSKG